MQDSENKDSQSFLKLDSFDLLQYFYKNKLQILIITFLGFVSSFIISFLITPKYASSAIIYPAASTSVSKQILSNVTLIEKNILSLGKIKDVEQMLQILSSEQIQSYIVKKYDLINHYKISNQADDLNAIWNANIRFSKTNLQAIEIKVLDTDKNLAALIANDIAVYIDTVINNLFREKALKIYYIVEDEVNDVKKNIKNIEDSIKRKGGSINFTLMNYPNHQIDSIQLSNFKINNEYSSLLFQLAKENERLALLHTKLSEAKIDAFHNLPNKYIVSKAYPSDKKVYPVHWLIILFSTISSFLFSLFVIITIDFIKQFKLNLNKK